MAIKENGMTPTRKAVDWLSHLPEGGRQIREVLKEADELDAKIAELERQLRSIRDYAATMPRRAEVIAETSWTAKEIQCAKEDAGVK